MVKETKDKDKNFMSKIMDNFSIKKPRKEQKTKDEGFKPPEGFGLGDFTKLVLQIIILKPIMWISAAVFELASYYYNGGCTDCHKRASILNKWAPDIFNMLWGLADNKEDGKDTK